MVSGSYLNLPYIWVLSTGTSGVHRLAFQAEGEHRVSDKQH